MCFCECVYSPIVYAIGCVSLLVNDLVIVKISSECYVMCVDVKFPLEEL
jgi:hypothetical protein